MNTHTLKTGAMRTAKISAGEFLLSRQPLPQFDQGIGARAMILADQKRIDFE